MCKTYSVFKQPWTSKRSTSPGLKGKREKMNNIKNIVHEQGRLLLKNPKQLTNQQTNQPTQKQ